MHVIVARQRNEAQGNNSAVISTQFIAPTPERIKAQTGLNVSIFIVLYNALFFDNFC